MCIIRRCRIILHQLFVVKMEVLNRLNYVNFVDIKLRVQNECVFKEEYPDTCS